MDKANLQPDYVQKDSVEFLYIMNTRLPDVCGETDTTPAAGTCLSSLVYHLQMW